MVEVKTSESINIPRVLNVVKKLIFALRMEKQHIIRHLKCSDETERGKSIFRS